MDLKKHSKMFKNNSLTAFLAAGLAVFLGAGPTGATQDWQAGPQLGPAGQASAAAPLAVAPKAGGKVARAFMGGRQSTWTALLSKLRPAARDLNQSSRRGVSRAFGGGSQNNWLDAFRSEPSDSAKAAGTACSGVFVALTGRVGDAGEDRCDRVSNLLRYR